MADPKPIIINNFQGGIASSPLFGFQEIRGLNITEKPGLVYPNDSLTNDDGASVVAALPLTMTEDASGNQWAHDGTGQKVYKRIGQDTWAEQSNHSAANIFGIQHYKGYIAIIYDANIEWYTVATGAVDDTWASALTSGSGTLSGKSIKPSLIASDDVMYVGSGNVVDSIQEDDGQDFDPADGANGTSTTTTKAALDLPEDENINEIVEMGDYIYLCCDFKLYPWDKSSSSFNRPVTFNKEIKQVIVYNNLMFVQAGYKGEWFVTNGITIEPINKLPETLVDVGSGQITVGRPGIHNELIYFGVGGAAAFTPQGVYSLNPRTGAITLEHIISTNGYGSTNNILFGQFYSLSPSSDGFLIPWSENSVYGIDRVNSGTEYTSDKAYLVTRFYPVGTYSVPRSFHRPEIHLSKPMVANDSVKVYYRTNINGSWTTHYSNTTTGFQNGIMDPITDVANIQLKVVLNNQAELFQIILI